MDDATVMIVAKRVESALECAAYITTEIETTEWTKLCSHAKTVSTMKKMSSRQRRGTQSDGRMPKSVNSSGKSSTLMRSSVLVSVKDGQSDAGSVANDATGAFPLLNMGIHYGFGIIEHDTETEFVSYHGLAVNTAASVADTAAPRQVLVSREVVDVVEENGVFEGGSFKPFSPVDMHGSVRTATATDAADSPTNHFSVFIPVGMPTDYETNAIDRKKSRLESGGIATALATADAGLARRKLAVLSIRIPELAALSASFSGNIKDVSDILAELGDVVTECRGTVLGVLGSQVVVGVNAVGPIVSQPASRAAGLARRLLLAFDAEEHGATSIGIAVGTCVASAGVCLGDVCATAETMRLAAVAAGVPIAASGTALQDLDSKFQLLTIDCLALPDAVGPCRVYAVLAEIVANDEWLYAMNKADYVRANEDAWANVIDLIERGDTSHLVEALELSVLSLRPHTEAEEMYIEVAASLHASLARLSSLREVATASTLCAPECWQSRFVTLLTPWDKQGRLITSTTPPATA